MSFFNIIIAVGVTIMGVIGLAALTTFVANKVIVSMWDN